MPRNSKLRTYVAVIEVDAVTIEAGAMRARLYLQNLCHPLSEFGLTLHVTERPQKLNAVLKRLRQANLKDAVGKLHATGVASAAELVSACGGAIPAVGWTARLRRGLGVPSTEEQAVASMCEALMLHAHFGQKRRGGEPYATHPRRVAGSAWAVGKTVYHYCAGLLHDTLEDNPTFTAESLLACVVPKEVVKAVVALTKKEGENYTHYLRRVGQNPIATVVKIADIEDNLADNPKPDKVPAYQSALAFLRKRQLCHENTSKKQVTPP